MTSLRPQILTYESPLCLPGRPTIKGLGWWRNVARLNDDSRATAVVVAAKGTESSMTCYEPIVPKSWSFL